MLEKLIFALMIPFLAAGSPGPVQTRPGALRAIIFSGHNNHDWRLTTPYLKKLLRDSGRFDVRVEEEPSGVTAKTLAGFDVIVLDYNGPRWGRYTEEAVASFVRSGKGLVVVHGASYAFSGLEILGARHVPTGRVEPAWPVYAEMIGGTWSDQPPKTGHGKRHSFTVKFVDTAHPITRRLGASFVATDELYHHMRMRPDAHILATAWDDPAMDGSGRDEPILWTVNYERGRVFHTTLGHDLTAMCETGFINTFARGTEWAASGAVTIPAVTSAFQHKPDALRTLVVTGGHDYDPSFYTLFARDDIAWRHVASNNEAFAADFRPKYDVLVLYDLSTDIGEAQRRNLRDFVEAGKGIVVLHHAIADYNSWPWWYRDVVGGRYLLKPDAGTPASTYSHGEEEFITPVLQHPITAGMGPFHLWDETYKGMWISPEVKILLKTNNQTSDGPVAWISPYSKSRVVYIQLGHGRTAHLHPAYRELVHKAILWSAGRLP